MKRWLLRLVSLLVVLALVGAGAALLGYRDFVDAGPLAEPKTVVLPRGAGVEGVARALESTGVIRHHQVFIVGVALLGAQRPLKAGEYAFPAGIAAAEVMRLLQEGRTVVRRLTVAEGLTTAQVLALIAGAEALDGALPAPPPGEGELLPETYNYSWGDPRAGMVQRLRRGMSELLAEAWRRRATAEALYSAPDGTGGRVFGPTREEHNRNVARWRRLQGKKSE